MAARSSAAAMLAPPSGRALSAGRADIAASAVANGDEPRPSVSGLPWRSACRPRRAADDVGTHVACFHADALTGCAMPSGIRHAQHRAHRQSRRDRLPHHPHREAARDAHDRRLLGGRRRSALRSRGRRGPSHRAGAGARELSRRSTRSSRSRRGPARPASIRATASSPSARNSPTPARRTASSSSGRRPPRSARWG